MLSQAIHDIDIHYQKAGIGSINGNDGGNIMGNFS